jgi:hypothetical protein
VLFTFSNGPATDVFVRPSVASASSGGTATTLEAFGVGGNSLGVFTYYGPGDGGFFFNSDLSSRVGGVPISSFLITAGVSSGGTVGTITYAAAVDPVPEPEEYAVMGMAGMCLCGLMIQAKRRRTAMSGMGNAA